MLGGDSVGGLVRLGFPRQARGRCCKEPGPDRPCPLLGQRGGGVNAGFLPPLGGPAFRGLSVHKQRRWNQVPLCFEGVRRWVAGEGLEG